MSINVALTFCDKFVIWAPAWPELTLRIHLAQLTLSTGDGAFIMALKPLGGVNRSPKPVAPQNGDLSPKLKTNKQTYDVKVFHNSVIYF